MVVLDQQRAATAAARTINTPGGAKIIPIQDGLYDLFQGDGWKHQSRFRIVKLRNQKWDGKKKADQYTRQLIQVNGMVLSQEQRYALLQLVH